MKRIDSETQSYVLLARRGDPSAFYALFYGQIRSLYLLHRSQGKDHKGACDAASETLARLYRRFIRARFGCSGKWFAARCGLKRLDPAAAEAAATGAEVASYERLAVRTVNKAYSERLGVDGDSKGEVGVGGSSLRYLIGSAVAAVAVVVLFLTGAVLSVSFERFGSEYKLSFPKMAEGLWDVSGLVRDDAGSAPPPYSKAAQPARTGADGAETPPRP